MPAILFCTRIFLLPILLGGKRVCLNRPWINLAICFTIIIHTCSSTKVHAVEFQEIEDAWKSRHKYFRTVQVEWTEQRISQIQSSPGRNDWKEIVQQLPNMRIYFEGNKVRFEDVFAGNTPRQTGPLILAYNGAEYRNLSYADGQLKQEPQGLITGPKTGAFSSSAAALPLLLFYRGSQEKLAESALSYYRSSELEIDAAKDVLLHANIRLADGSESRCTLKVRPSLNYAPVQLIRSVNGTAAIDVRLEYEPSKTGWPELKGWTILMMRPKNELLLSTKAHVTSCKVNESIDHALFDLPFPVGTLVEDYRKTSSISDGPRWFLSLQDGEREVLPSELGRISRRELERTKPGEAEDSRSHGSRPWLIGLNVAIILILVVLLFNRMRATNTGP